MKSLLDQLSSQYHLDHSHVEATQYNSEDSAWVAAGKPHLWRIVEEDKEVKVYFDVAYGGFAVVINEKLEGRSSYMLNVRGILIVNPNTFNVEKWIWR